MTAARMTFADAHALVIGITRYQRVPELRQTLDAQDVAELLRDPDACAYPPAAVHTLVDEAATRDAIYGALDALARDTRESSTVFVYFSGHGAHAKTAEGDAYYFMPVEGAHKPAGELERTAISNRELSARLQAIPAARLTVVLDCCKSAEIAELELTASAVESLARGRGRAVLAASWSDAYSMPRERNSEFTRHLLTGLRGAASGVGGVIRVCDLFHYVQQQIAARPMGQRPVFKAELEENYPIARLRTGAPELAPLPVADDFAYDVFLSYRPDDLEDRAWAEDVVVPFLEQRGVRVCYAHRDFRLGGSRIAETERAVARSRYTAAVLTPAYLAGPFEEMQWMIAQQSGLQRIVPLLRRTCPISLHARMTEIYDVSKDTEVEAALLRLAVTLRESPRPRLGDAAVR